jgi:hypothetical protein
MSHRIYILVVAGMVLFGGTATYHWVQFEDARQDWPEASHNLFQALDNSCCAGGAPSDLCAPLWARPALPPCGVGADTRLESRSTR